MQVGQLVARLHGTPANGSGLAGATLLYNARHTSPHSASASPPLSGSWGEPLRLSLLHPAIGPAAGGGALTLFGRGFGPLAAPLAPHVAVCVWGGGEDASTAFALSHLSHTATTGDAAECEVPSFAAAPPPYAAAVPSAPPQPPRPRLPLSPAATPRTPLVPPTRLPLGPALRAASQLAPSLYASPC